MIVVTLPFAAVDVLEMVGLRTTVSDWATVEDGVEEAADGLVFQPGTRPPLELLTRSVEAAVESGATEDVIGGICEVDVGSKEVSVNSGATETPRILCVVSSVGNGSELVATELDTVMEAWLWELD